MSKPTTIYIRSGAAILRLDPETREVVESITLPSVTHAKRYNRVKLGGAAIQATSVGKIKFAANCSHLAVRFPRSASDEGTGA